VQLLFSWFFLFLGCWLLVAGCWLLVAGCWLLVTSNQQIFIGDFQKKISRDYDEYEALISRGPM
jgi:hypothetical protein